MANDIGWGSPFDAESGYGMAAVNGQSTGYGNVVVNSYSGETNISAIDDDNFPISRNSYITYEEGQTNKLEAVILPGAAYTVISNTYEWRYNDEIVGTDSTIDIIGLDMYQCTVSTELEGVEGNVITYLGFAPDLFSEYPVAYIDNDVLYCYFKYNDKLSIYGINITLFENGIEAGTESVTEDGIIYIIADPEPGEYSVQVQIYLNSELQEKYESNPVLVGLSTIPVYSQIVDFSTTPMNSIVYRCDGHFLAASYGTNQTNLTDLINMFNQLPPVQPQATFMEYGVCYDNGDGRIRMEMIPSVYAAFECADNLTLDVIYD
jgi:hypothetical protein